MSALAPRGANIAEPASKAASERINFVNLFIVFLPLPFPLLIDFGFGAGKHGTSSDAPMEVCEIDLERHIRGGETARRQCPSFASFFG